MRLEVQLFFHVTDTSLIVSNTITAKFLNAFIILQCYLPFLVSFHWRSKEFKRICSSESSLKDTRQSIEHAGNNELKSAAACFSLTSVNWSDNNSKGLPFFGSLVLLLQFPTFLSSPFPIKKCRTSNSHSASVGYGMTYFAAWCLNYRTVVNCYERSLWRMTGSDNLCDSKFHLSTPDQYLLRLNKPNI